MIVAGSSRHTVQVEAHVPCRVVVLSESAALGECIGRECGVPVAPLEERDFEDGEFKLRPLVSLRNQSVVAVQTLAASSQASIAQRLVRLLFLLCGLRDAGATRITAVIPYLAFARKDRRTQPRDPVTTRYVAQLLEAAGLDRLLALDVHNGAALDNAFRVPVDHLSALPMFAHHFAAALAEETVAVASPDVGGIKRAQLFCEQLGALLGRDIDLLFVEKRRAGGKVESGGVVGDATGRSVIVLDDLCASGGTLIRAAVALRLAGARAVRVAVTHLPIAAGAAALKAADAITQIVTTDSVGPLAHLISASNDPKFTVLPIAPLFGNALARMLRGEPLTPLLQRWPPTGA